MFRSRNLAALAVLALSGSSLSKPVAGGSWVGETCVCPPSDCPPVVTSYTTITATPVYTFTVTKTISHEVTPPANTTPGPSTGPAGVPSSPIVIHTPPTTAPLETTVKTTTISGSKIVVTSTITLIQTPPQSTIPCETITRTITTSGTVVVITTTITPSQPPVQTAVVGTPIITTVPGFTIITTIPGTIITSSIPGSVVVITKTISPTTETTVIPCDSTLTLTQTGTVIKTTRPVSTITLTESGHIVTSTYQPSTLYVTYSSNIYTTVVTATTITKTISVSTLTINKTGEIVQTTVPGSTSIITIPGSVITSTVTPISATTTLPSSTCQYDPCLKQILESSAVTPFCATYTASVHTIPISLPACVSECDTAPGALSSACSCLFGQYTPVIITTSSTIFDPSFTPTASSKSPCKHCTEVLTIPQPSITPSNGICSTGLIISTITITTTFIQVLTTTSSIPVSPPTTHISSSVGFSDDTSSTGTFFPATSSTVVLSLSAAQSASIAPSSSAQRTGSSSSSSRVALW
ncbi:hypothetical protein ACHAO1_010045 [Botrytis cinerea]